jgi:hypothetical protein
MSSMSLWLNWTEMLSDWAYRDLSLAKIHYIYIL